MSKSCVLLLAAIATAAMPALAQTSPPKVLNATVGSAKIKMDYFAPSMRGRKIFGALVPYDHVWCPGANWATTIDVDADFQLGSLKLKKGAYALWVNPHANEFELIVNSDTRAFHLDYRSDKDIGRMKMNLKKLDKPVEQLTFEIRPDGGNKGTLALMWENTEASVPIVIGQ
jgi:hypothetical protein